MLESLPLWVRVHGQVPLSEQAELSGLTDRTLRRWVGGESRPYPSSSRLYVEWLCSEVLAPLDHSTFAACASIPSGWRPFWGASATSSCLVVVWRGRIVRHQIAVRPPQERLELLRPRLIAQVYEWGREALGASSDEI